MPKSQKSIQEDVFLGIDYGERNIGLALGRNGYVSPLSIVPGANMMTAVHEITRLALENKVSKFIVGIPLTGDGKETQQSLATRKFVKLLKIISKKPAIFVNEFDSSKEAQAEKAYFGVSAKKAALSDHVSAAIILRRFFETR